MPTQPWAGITGANRAGLALGGNVHAAQ